MIDILWITIDNKIKCIFEVENSTGFIAALQRASNLDRATYKFMVIPDEREDELMGISDPLFMEVFYSHNWHYVTYSSLERLLHHARPSFEEMLNISRSIIR